MNKTNSEFPQAPVKEAQKRVRNYINRYGKDGSWPFLPGREPSTEATAWCMLSLDDRDPVLPKALKFLINLQNEDGGWSTGPSEGKSDWCTGPAMFALRTVAHKLSDNKGIASFDRGTNYLSETTFELYNMPARIILGAIQGVEKTEESPRGWPWSRGCYHWVEPTCYNLYAFKLPQPTKYKKGFETMVSRAEKFLLENTCSTGGWNHGSHLSLGVNLPPYIVTTAEALLALQNFPDHKEIGRAFDFLHANTEASQAGQKNSAMALAWMTLASHAYGRDSTKFLEHLISLQKEDGSFGPNMMVTALCSMALTTSDGVNPFKMSANSDQSDTKKAVR